MTETTRVPMTLRDHFFEDPFFSSNRNEMETFRNQFLKMIGVKQAGNRGAETTMNTQISAQ